MLLTGQHSCGGIAAILCNDAEVFLWEVILIVVYRSSAAVGMSHDQYNLSNLWHEIPHSSAVGRLIESTGTILS